MTAVVAIESGACAGWQAELDLEFQRREDRTVLTLNRHRGPLQVQKALYPESRATCHITVLHPPGGIAAGDQLQVRAQLDPQSQVLLTTPGATKWYRSEGARATQRLTFTLARDSTLEWLPRENIFFDGVNAALELDIDLQPGAKYVGWDIYCFGRRASGETWKHGELRMHSRIRCEKGLLWSEMARVAGSSDFAASPMGLGGYSVCGTLIAARCPIHALLPGLRAVPAPPHARVGLTVLPEVLIARYLGDSGDEAFAWFTALWTLIRPSALGRDAYPPRVWAC
jgi:urease accessory protein